MSTNNPLRWSPLLLGLAVGGCSDTLIYAERTSLDVAAVRIGQATDPLEFHVGLRRNVATLAPPLGGVVEADKQRIPSGDAVSMLSGYELTYDKQTTPVLFGKLTIKTRFASGEAALKMAEVPTAAKALVEVQGGAPCDQAEANRRANAYQFLGNVADQGKLDEAAGRLKVAPGPNVKGRLQDTVMACGLNDFDKIALNFKAVFNRDF